MYGMAYIRTYVMPSSIKFVSPYAPCETHDVRRTWCHVHHRTRSPAMPIWRYVRRDGSRGDAWRDGLPTMHCCRCEFSCRFPIDLTANGRPLVHFMANRADMTAMATTTPHMADMAMATVIRRCRCHRTVTTPWNESPNTRIKRRFQRWQNQPLPRCIQCPW